MRVENAQKEQLKAISHNMSSKLLTHPLFMYYCPEKAVRREFINCYFNYYMNIWQKNDIVLCNDENTAIVSIVNPREYSFKFSGKGAGRLKEFKLSPNIFQHQSEIQQIFDVVVPETREGRVMLVYASINTEFNDVQKLVKEAMEIAKKENFILLYDTFSLRLQPLMRTFGFKLVYNKNFLDTNFLHSVMVHNFN